MSRDKLLSVGYYKGEMDFGVSGCVGELTYEEMKEFREMTIVAIGVAEEMWKRSLEQKRMENNNER